MGIEGDRIVAIGDLAAVDDTGVATVIDATSHVVAPGFVDPHGHSDGTLFVDGALVSHLAQGYTTQLSGNCGYTFAPLTPPARAMLDADLAALELAPEWTTFAGFLDAVDAQSLGLNVAFLVGHGTVRSAVLGPDRRAPTPTELAAMVAHVDEALDAGAAGVSSGLIYAPGVHARPDEVAALAAARPAATRCTPRTCATSPRACSGRSTRRSRRPAWRACWPGGHRGSRSRISRRARAPCGGRPMRSSSGWTPRAATASTSPPTSTRTRRRPRPSRRPCRRRSWRSRSTTRSRRCGTRRRGRRSAGSSRPASRAGRT